MLLGAHSRLVLLWQNNDEADLFCKKELTTLQVNVVLAARVESLGKEAPDPTPPRTGSAVPGTEEFFRGSQTLRKMQQV